VSHQLLARLQGGQDRLMLVDGDLSHVAQDDASPDAGPGGAPGEPVDKSGQRLVAGCRDDQPVEGDVGYGEGIIVNVFAAALIGGVSLKGGRGNMIGAASGVILLGIVQNILDLTNVSNYWIEAIDGAVILFALFLARIVGGESTAEER
jgi:hypothetical protein